MSPARSPLREERRHLKKDHFHLTTYHDRDVASLPNVGAVVGIHDFQTRVAIPSWDFYEAETEKKLFRHMLGSRPSLRMILASIPVVAIASIQKMRRATVHLVRRKRFYLKSPAMSIFYGS